MTCENEEHDSAAIYEPTSKEEDTQICDMHVNGYGSVIEYVVRGLQLVTSRTQTFCASKNVGFENKDNM